MHKLKALFLIILLSAGIGANASAATFTVNSTTDAADAAPGNGSCATATGQCTLRAAIQEANMFTGKDTIILPAGTYYIALPGKYEDASATGDLDILQSVTIQGAGSADTIVDGNNLDRAFHILDGNVEISGITIRNGKAVLQYGGGIYNYYGDITLTDCTVFSNRADLSGGGIYNYAGTVQIMGSTVSGNTAVFLSAYGYGDGGGIYNALGSVTITDSAISGNIASGYGWTGGIVNGGTMTIEKSTINDNIAYLYAGIDSFGNMTITNSTIYNNSSTSTDDCWDGAGVINEDIMTIQNSTIVDNLPANISNGDYCYLYGGTFNIRNSIVKNTNPRVNCVLPDVPFHSSSKNNLSTDNTCGTSFSQQTASQINLGPLADYGGPTDTLALLAGSVAIEGGDDASCPGTDQRGVLRPQGTHCDIGAFEYESAEPKSDQTITVDEHAPANALYNSSFTVSATASSGLEVAITTSGACSGSGNDSALITMTNGTGTCTVFFDQAGNGAYNPAPQVIEYTNAQKVDQTINVSQHAPANAPYNSTFAVSATATSGLGVAITTSGACSGGGTGSALITMTDGTGTCTIFYNQAGDGTCNPAPQVTETTAAQKADQTITVIQHAPTSAAYGTSFTVSATASSGLGVEITTSGACSGGGTGSALITMSSLTDTCTIFCDQGGNAYFNPAPQVIETTLQYMLTVTPLGTGSGSVSGNGITCDWDGGSSSGTCSIGFDYNAGFNLSATASACSYLKEWGNACSGADSQCTGTMTEQKTVEATFVLHPLARLSSVMDGYDVIKDVYDTISGGVIQIQAHNFAEDLVLDSPIDVTLEGGWNCDYTQLDGVATINSLTVQSGSATFQDGTLVVAPVP